MLADGVYVTHTLNWVNDEVIANHKCYLSTRKQSLTKKTPKHITNFYVSIFSKSLFFGAWCKNG